MPIEHNATPPVKEEVMHRSVVLSWLLVGILSVAALGALPTQAAAPPVASPQSLRLATTTSTYDTGLLDAILPDFEAAYDAKVDVVAVGTGQALAIGAKGDADVVLVHATAQEDKFVADGDGINRLDVMYNDFVVVGPKDDPAAIGGMPTAKEAFTQIATKAAPFVSRGDGSGTENKEKSIWASAGITPITQSAWYFSIGQGMGETLVFANEKGAYTLTDRGTWLATKANLPDLALLVGGATVAENKDKGLLNFYGVIPVNPAKHAGVNFELATQFANWMTSPEEQKIIAEFGKDKFGQSLFYPNSEAFKATLTPTPAPTAAATVAPTEAPTAAPTASS
jgi:tungstate transport system substrate-binding protein